MTESRKGRKDREKESLVCEITREREGKKREKLFRVNIVCLRSASTLHHQC